MNQINKIPSDPNVQVEPQHEYEVRVTDLKTGEIMYLDRSFAGVMCTMEEVKKIGVEVEGERQNVGWGNPYLQWYTFDQLGKWFKKEIPKVFAEAQRIGAIKSTINLEDLFN